MTDQITTICQNRKAQYDYFVDQVIECGIVLNGSEIKSIRDRGITLDASYAIVKNNEVWLVDCNIDPYKNTKSYAPDPKRERKLLLNRDQINRVEKYAALQGQSLIPLQVIIKNGICKINVGLCRGKKSHDKREAIKEREAKKEIDT